LPLLVTIYFALSRRNPATGLLLGGSIGILQDAVSHLPIGIYGIAKTLVGYAASSLGGRVDTEHPVSRFIMVVIFYHFHEAVLAILNRVLLARPATYFSWKLLIASAVNAGIAVLLFPVLDHLRKPS
jgi:rod shape-determining protein MreD